MDLPNALIKSQWFMGIFVGPVAPAGSNIHRTASGVTS
jgi:hypothetical protein